MIYQTTFHLSAKRRGCHLVTQEILEHLPKPLPKAGLLNLFVQHTSCALSINENYDPNVRTDMEAILNHMVKEREPYYEHAPGSAEFDAARAILGKVETPNRGRNKRIGRILYIKRNRCVGKVL